LGKLLWINRCKCTQLDVMIYKFLLFSLFDLASLLPALAPDESSRHS
jgi:hypothetical protein